MLATEKLPSSQTVNIVYWDTSPTTPLCQFFVVGLFMFFPAADASTDLSLWLPFTEVGSPSFCMFPVYSQEDIKALSMHVVEHFPKELDAVKYVKTFETLKLRYKQQQERLKDMVIMDGYVCVHAA